jgi:hypothetical protein
MKPSSPVSRGTCLWPKCGARDLTDVHALSWLQLPSTRPTRSPSVRPTKVRDSLALPHWPLRLS